MSSTSSFVSVRRRGAVLISLLAVTVVVTMFIGILLTRGQKSLFHSAHYRDGVKAEQAARAGANHILSLLEDDPTFNNDVLVDLNGATYTITFDPSDPSFSVNNLTSAVAATQISFQGHEVAPLSADIVVVGRCGLSQRTVRVVLQRGLPSLRAVAAVGRIRLSGDVLVDGVKSLLTPPGETDPDSAPGGLLSKYQSPDASDPSISWDGSGTFDLSPLSDLETASPLSGGQSFSSNLELAFPDQLNGNGAADSIPDIDVAAKVTQGMTYPSLAPGGSVINSYVTLDSQHSVDGNFTVNGDLILNGGTLYVNGELRVNGGIKGRGTIYVRDDFEMVGGNTLVQAGEPNGTTLLCGGDVDLQGIDASGYLQSLAAGDLAIDAALTNLNNRLTQYAGLGSNAASYYGISLELTKAVGGSPGPGDTTWMSPLPGPDGTHYMGFTNGVIPALTVAIKNTGLHLTDPRAEKVISALEEMHYHFRDNGAAHTISMTNRSVNDSYQLVDNGVVQTGAQTDAIRAAEDNPWDDRNLPFKFRTHTALAYNNVDGDSNADAYALARKRAYIANNPLDFSWLGDSTFQGLIYARGDIDASQGVKIVGTLTTLGHVDLTGGSKLIYNEEYRDLLAPDSPIAVLHFEEI